MQEGVIEESVEVSTETIAEEPKEPSYADLIDFVWEDYYDFFPEEWKKSLVTMFQEKSYGWMTRARKLIKIKEEKDFVKKLEDELVDLCSPVQRGRVKGSKLIATPRDGICLALKDKSEGALRKMCEFYSVSYDSFMNSGDKVGLLETLADEILREDL